MQVKDLVHIYELFLYTQSPLFHIVRLKCMGNVYRTIHDEDNSICCFVNALEMTNKKLNSVRVSLDEFHSMGLHLGLAVPIPTIVLDEMRTIGGAGHFQTMNKRCLCHVFTPEIEKRQVQLTASKLQKRLTRMHLTVIKLIRDRNRDTSESRTRTPVISSMLASLPLKFMTGGDEIESALMRSSFFMGRLKLEQAKYEEAAEYLEAALRSKWRLDPASSSDSDSDFSRKSKCRKQQGKFLDDDNLDEGQIYYALGICNAALEDHERSVRCFLTALRYLRRSLRNVDSLAVARVLFDCATSYYYAANFEQSVYYYGECLRTLNGYDNRANSTLNDVSNSNYSSKCIHRGIGLYCLAAAKSAIAIDSEVSKTLAEAQALLSECKDKELLAYTTFMLGQVKRHDASNIPVHLRSVTRIVATGLGSETTGLGSETTGLGSETSIGWMEMCNISLHLFDEAKNDCWFDPLNNSTELKEVKHLPLSGHICFEKGRVYELLGSVDQALKSFADAAHFYRIACGDENVYLGYTLHTMGLITSQWRELHALDYFNEALSIRKKLLGSDDTAVAETLYFSALVLAQLNRYEASLERFNEALRIQMKHNQDSHEVARTLAGK